MAEIILFNYSNCKSGLHTTFNFLAAEMSPVNGAKKVDEE